MDLSPLFPALAGAVVAALAGFFGAWIQGRREHAKWVREKRYEAFEKAYAVAMEMNSVEQAVEDLAGQFGVSPDQSGVSVDRLEQLKARVTRLRSDMSNATAPIAVLGPESVNRALAMFSRSETKDGFDATHTELISTMRQALKIKD